MSDNPFFFDELPLLAPKPRRTGVTMVRDDGMPFEEFTGALRDYGVLLDYMKFRQFIVFYTDPGLIRAKIAACAEADVRTFFGGTVLELAHLHGKTEYALDQMHDYGLTAVEVSHSMVPLTTEQLSRVVRLATDRGFEVLYEYGKKFQEQAFDVESAIADINELLAAGASRVIIEKWQIDAAMGYHADSGTANRMLDLADGVGLEHLVFEAEHLEQQLWLLRELGPDINLGPNLAPFHVPSKLGPYRVGIGSEVGYTIFKTVSERLAEPEPATLI